jgi:Caspase domain
VRDDDGDDKDGRDETLVPVDYAEAGQIRDDDLYDDLVCAMPEGSTLVALMYCCHSATVLDLPYAYKAFSVNSFRPPGFIIGDKPMAMCCCCCVVIAAVIGGTVAFILT